jgi:hypothetical protein
MTDQQLALQAINEAQLILKAVEIPERPDLVVAVSRLQQQSSLSVRK